MIEASAEHPGSRWAPYLRRAALPALLIGLLLLISVTAIRSSWSAAEFVARTRTESMVIGANRQVTMLFEGARLGLDRLAEAVDRASGSDPASLSVAATHIARENPFVFDAIVQDRRGVVVAAAGPGDGVGLDLGHLDHVRALLAPGAARYWIGEPFDARGMGDLLVPLARTVTDAAIALAVMAGKDSLDPTTLSAPDSARVP